MAKRIINKRLGEGVLPRGLRERRRPRQSCLIPIDRIGNALTLAMADPSNVQAIEDIELLTKCVVQTFVSTPTDIGKAIEKFYPPETNAPRGPASRKEKRDGQS